MDAVRAAPQGARQLRTFSEEKLLWPASAGRRLARETRSLSCGRIDDVGAAWHRVDVFMKTASSSLLWSH